MITQREAILIDAIAHLQACLSSCGKVIENHLDRITDEDKEHLKQAMSSRTEFSIKAYSFTFLSEVEDFKSNLN